MCIHQMEKVETTCSDCGVGCQMELRVALGKAWGVTTDDEKGPNKGSLCVKGRFGFDFIDHQERVKNSSDQGKRASSGGVLGRGFLPSPPGGLMEIRHVQRSRILIMGFNIGPLHERGKLFVPEIHARGVGTNNVDHCARL